MAPQPTRKTSAFWGQYSDLYDTLEASEVELLEKAVFARKLGRFGEARGIHNEKLPQSRLVPVLALEKANLASQLGLAGDQYAILEEALNSSTEWRQSSSQSDIALLEISLAEAKFQWTGGTKEALHKARNLRDRWIRADSDKWTDVEVSHDCADRQDTADLSRSRSQSNTSRS